MHSNALGTYASATTAVDANYVPGLGVVDPFARRTSSLSSMLHAIMATAIFRCWHILMFFGAWSTAVSVLTHNVYDLSISPTLLTVLGTVLGFVISYRTTSSFERYNEGRRLWSQIILGSRNFARTVWFHVPEVLGEGQFTAEEKKARVMVEKVTVINLLLAFATSVKHYLRGEDGIYYEDLYHLVKFLPAYALPAGMPSKVDVHDHAETTSSDGTQGRPSDVFSVQSSKHAPGDVTLQSPPLRAKRGRAASNAQHLPMPVSAAPKGRGGGQPLPPMPQSPRSARSMDGPAPQSPRSARSLGARMPQSPRSARSAGGDGEKGDWDEGGLLPAVNPPKWGMFDVFPLSLFITTRTRRGKEVGGKKAARVRAKLRGENTSHNIPLEVSLYLSSYVAQLQQRKAIDPPTATNLLNTLNQLVDALTGLERILTTPIPFSYSVHLWTVTGIYCLILPFQVWDTLKWLTIPSTVIVSFVFFGFLVAGEEIENPFGYDKNDLNMDHFTHNIIRNELRAIMCAPPPDISVWAFSPSNDALFATSPPAEDRSDRAAPEEWLRRGTREMQAALST